MTYDNILRLSDDPDVNDVIKFLRAREIVHFQRFGEGLRLAKEKLGEKNIYYMNPSMDQWPSYLAAGKRRRSVCCGGAILFPSAWPFGPQARNWSRGRRSSKAAIASAMPDTSPTRFTPQSFPAAK